MPSLFIPLIRRVLFGDEIELRMTTADLNEEEIKKKRDENDDEKGEFIVGGGFICFVV